MCTNCKNCDCKTKKKEELEKWLISKNISDLVVSTGEFEISNKIESEITHETGFVDLVH